jgi:hypothetical protein
MTDTPASWLPDPTGRHDHRYWDGTGWTEHVADAGVAAIEPYEPAPPPAPGPAVGDDDPTQPGWAAPQDDPAHSSGESPSAADDPTAVHDAVGPAAGRASSSSGWACWPSPPSWASRWP